MAGGDAGVAVRSQPRSWTGEERERDRARVRARCLVQRLGFRALDSTPPQPSPSTGEPRRQPPAATVVKGLETPVWKWVELGSDFEWVGHGLGLFVRSESGESKMGVFKYLRSSLAPSNESSSLESRWVFLAS